MPQSNSCLAPFQHLKSEMSALFAWVTIRRFVKQFFFSANFRWVFRCLLLIRGCDWWNPDCSQGIEELKDGENWNTSRDKHQVCSLKTHISVILCKRNVQVSNIFLFNIKMWKVVKSMGKQIILLIKKLVLIFCYFNCFENSFDFLNSLKCWWTKSLFWR